MYAIRSYYAVHLQLPLRTADYHDLPFDGAVLCRAAAQRAGDYLLAGVDVVVGALIRDY